MNKRDLAKIFIECFRTNITDITLSGELKGTGGTAETRHCGEVVFFNHSEYEKKKFSNDFKKFFVKLAEIYGADKVTYKVPKKASRSKSFFYQWDPVHIINVNGMEFRMGRKMPNMPHAILNGCSHTYYITINDLDFVKEIDILNKERLDKEELEEIKGWPKRELEALNQCNEMIERLKSIVDGNIEITRDNIDRINMAHTELCIFIDNSN